MCKYNFWVWEWIEVKCTFNRSICYAPILRFLLSTADFQLSYRFRCKGLVKLITQILIIGYYIPIKCYRLHVCHSSVTTWNSSSDIYLIWFLHPIWPVHWQSFERIKTGIQTVMSPQSSIRGNWIGLATFGYNLGSWNSRLQINKK